MTTQTALINAYALSDQQLLAWLDRQDAGGWVQGELHVEGPVDVDVLARAIDAVLVRHEIFRTHFKMSPARRYPVQVVDDDVPVVDRVDLRSEPPEGRAQALASASSRWAAEPLDVLGQSNVSVLLAHLAADRVALVIRLSPLCADASTLRNLNDELAATYGAIAQNSPPADSDVVQYADYTAWQEEARSGLEAAAAEHWSGAEAGELPAAFLRSQPSDAGDVGLAPVPAVVSLTGDRLDALEARAATVGTDVPTVVLGGLMAWLWRVTRREYVAVDCILDGRGEELDAAMGRFSRRLPLASDLSGELSFDRVVANLTERIRRSQECQEGARTGTRATPRGVVFEAVPSSDAAEAAGVRFRVAGAPVNDVPCTLRLSCFRSDDGVRLEVVGDAGGLDDGATAAIAAQLETLLASVAAGTEEIGSLVLVDDEQRRVLEGFSRGSRTTPPTSSIHRLFSEQARRTPERDAVVFGDTTLTYAELDEQSNRIAHVLQHNGVGLGKLVGVCVDRSPEMLAAVLGVMKAGAAYVPLDPSTLNPGRPSYPRQRLAFMFEDTAIPVVLTQDRFLDGLPESAAKLISLDDRAQFESVPASEPEDGAGPDSLAYVIYTSGSTGRPKGVMIEHRSVLNLWAGLRSEVYRGRAADHLTVSLNAPLGFDPSVQQIVMLLDGHTLVIVPEDIRADGRALLSFIERHRIDASDCTPSQLRLLLQSGLLDEERRYPSLILCGGEAMDVATWTALAAVDRPETFNLYGPTECTVDSTVARVSGPRPTIGRPLPNTSMHVLDENMSALPPGVVGELYVGGAGVGRGYLNREELTAQRFIGDAQRPDERLYRTGDLGRFLPDGSIEFLDRADDQVKVRSHRIEPGEVEAVLRQHPSVRDCSVAVRQDEAGERRLLAYYVPETNTTVTTSELRRSLQGWLPDYMVPSVFLELEQLPLTPNGKVDRRALPEAPHGRPSLDTDFVAPRDDLERRLAYLWGQTLRLDVEQIGVDDDFFDLGGDSLSAVSLLAGLEEEIGRELPLELAVQHATVGEQAAELRLHLDQT